MIKHNQDGAVSGLAISFVMVMLLLIGAVAFGAWAFLGRQDYKNNVDSKISVATEEAKQKESASKDLVFAEEAKKPLKIYNGPAAYGSIVLNYPKTWSGYVDDTGSSNNSSVDGFFAPGVVPSATSQTSVFALRVQLLNQTYAQVLQTFIGQQQSGKLTISAYSLPQLPKVVGVKVVGELQTQKTVTMIVLPLRSQTLQIWTEGTQYVADLNNNILPNFTFSP